MVNDVEKKNASSKKKLLYCRGAYSKLWENPAFDSSRQKVSPPRYVGRRENNGKIAFALLFLYRFLLATFSIFKKCVDDGHIFSWCHRSLRRWCVARYPMLRRIIAEIFLNCLNNGHTETHTHKDSSVFLGLLLKYFPVLENCDCEFNPFFMLFIITEK